LPRSQRVKGKPYTRVWWEATHTYKVLEFPKNNPWKKRFLPMVYDPVPYGNGDPFCPLRFGALSRTLTLEGAEGICQHHADNLRSRPGAPVPA
jgi:hypothetical protein